MSFLRGVAAFAAGALLVNAVPHGVQGVQGRRFPTPFATPPGRGLSTPVENVAWSAANAVGGALLLRTRRGSRAEAVALGLGAVSMAVLLAVFFADVDTDD